MRHRKYGIVQDVGGKLQCHKCRRRDCQHVDVVKYAVDNKDTEDIPSVVVVLQIAADLSENFMGSEWNNKYKSFRPIPFNIESNLLTKKPEDRLPKLNGTIALVPPIGGKCSCGAHASDELKIRRKSCSQCSHQIKF